MWPFDGAFQRIGQWNSSKSNERRIVWEELFKSYIAAREQQPSKFASVCLGWCDETERNIVKQATRLLATATEVDWAILEKMLQEGERKYLVARIFLMGRPLPPRLMESFIWAAVYETDPTDNRAFVDPCIAAFGRRFVNESFLDIIESGSNYEKAGAINALHWGTYNLLFKGHDKERTIENDTPESRKEYLELSDIWERRRNLFLSEFVSNPSLNVRRSIVNQLDLDESDYPDELKPLVAQAIDIARTHDDIFIRHRFEDRPEEKKRYVPLPERGEPLKRVSTSTTDQKSEEVERADHQIAELDDALHGINRRSSTEQRLGVLRKLVEYWYGPIHPEDGYPEDELKGMPIPLPLKCWYQFAGRREGILDGENSLYPPKWLKVDEDGRILFYHETMVTYVWSTMMDRTDPIVWGHCKEPGAQWTQEDMTLSEFMIGMCLYEIRYGARYGVREQWIDTHDYDAIASVITPLSLVSWRWPAVFPIRFHAKRGAFMISEAYSRNDNTPGYCVTIAAKSPEPLAFLKPIANGKWEYLKLD